MKKVFLSLVVLSVIGASAKAQVRFGAQAGTSVANLSIKSGSTKLSQDSKIGMTFGAAADISFTKAISLSTGLNFTQKGSSFKEGAIESSFTLNYLELPLNVVYKLNAGAGKVFFGAGPSLAYGISGKSKFSGNGVSESKKVNFGTEAENDDLKPFDLGGNILAGYEFSNGITAGVNYNIGLSNLSVTKDQKIKSSYFGLRVGYLFDKSSK